MTQTISEIIEIQSGYTNYVDLGHELFDDARNMGRMAQYRPIASHRQAFGKLASALNVLDGRCYLLTGSYGTGKSHLSLMFANYLRTPSNEPPMPQFFEHYAEVDPHAANTLRDKRLKKRYLVALCVWGGRGDFEEIVLNAVNEALQRAGFGEDFDTHYLQALKKLAEWEALANAGGAGGRFLDEFERELEQSNDGLTLNKFKQQLKAFDFATMSEFRRLHQKVTTAPFAYDKADLVEILQNTLQSAKFKERFAGALVLFDEFGYTMEQGHLSPKAFQRFAQLCGEAPVACAPLIFVGTAHKALTQYAKAYGSDDFRTASDRIKEIALSADGVEEIIGAIVAPQKNHALWQELVAPRADTFDGFVTDCQRLKLFDWLSAPRLRSAVIENIYPMHPMATYALLQLARDVASNNRSVFTFFAQEANAQAAPGSYGEFIAQQPILRENKLNLYTADRLFEYFASTLSSDNKELRETVRGHIKDYENSRRALNEAMAGNDSVRLLFEDDELVNRLLRLLLIDEIIGVPNRADNLYFGLYCTTQAEKDRLKNLVEALLKHGILYRIPETQVLEFKKSTAFDIDRRIEEWKHDAKNQPQNLVAELDELVPLSARNDLYLEAKDYNLTYSEDKRLERRLVRAADLEAEREVAGQKLNYFALLEKEISAEIAKKGDYEGLALYVVCDKVEEIAKAKNLCAKNQSARIVVAVPKQAVPLEEAIMELRALLAIEKSEDKKSFTVQDNAALDARLNGDASRKGARRALQELRDRLMNAREVHWYGQFAQSVPADPQKPYDAANRVMEALYDEGRNRFAHPDFNQLRATINTRNVALKEAVEKLAAYTEPLVVDTEFAQQRGDIRYLQKCLLNTGALRQKSSHASRLLCEFEGNADKYRGKLPTLAAMVEEIEGLGAGEKIRLGEWSVRYRGPQFGQGPIALAIFLACLRRRFGDSIRFKMDESAVGDMPVRSFDDLVRLSAGEYPNAYLSYKPLSADEKKLANMVFKLFGPPTGAETRDYTLLEAHEALKQWANALPPISRVARLYDADKHPHTAAFLAALQHLESKDAHAFLFETLPTAFGIDANAAITGATVQGLEAELQQEKQTLENALGVVEERVAQAVRQVFGVVGNTYSDLLGAVNEWYNGLDAQQRDLHASYHSNDSKPLIAQLKSLDDFHGTFLDKIPGSPDYGLRPVRDWAQDKVAEYTERLRSGKAHIEAHRIKVEPPTVSAHGNEKWAGKGELSFQDEVRIELETPLAGAKIFVSEGDADPTNAQAAREQFAPGQALVVRDNKRLRVAVQDAEGNWSPVETVQLINANREFVPVVIENALGRKTVEPFHFPTNRESLKVTCRELFRASLKLGIVAPDELQAAVQAALQEAQAPPADSDQNGTESA